MAFDGLTWFELKTETEKKNAFKCRTLIIIISANNMWTISRIFNPYEKEKKKTNKKSIYELMDLTTMILYNHYYYC